MLLYIKVGNILIYRSPVEFSLKANRHYKRFPTNYTTQCGVGVLKSAVLIGPNNCGKTNFVRIVALIRDIILNRGSRPGRNLFSDDNVSELSVSFIGDGRQYLLQFGYDTEKGEYIYERYASVERDRYGNTREDDILVRDVKKGEYRAEDEGLVPVMKVSSRTNIMMHVVDSSQFPSLSLFVSAALSFASKIDIVDMNNIPLSHTIRVVKGNGERRRKLVAFLRSADVDLDDLKYLSDEEAEKLSFDDSLSPQGGVLSSVSVDDILHLASVYRGVTVPSVLFDSTGTKKLEALSSYILDALEKGRILVVDELDGSLHFRLTRAIVALFNNVLNTSAQLIATVHDVSLLDCRTLLRQDQIWFAAKDRSDTYLYPLSTFTAGRDRMRGESDIAEMYRKGCLGAIPEPDLFESLLEVKDKSVT